MSDYRTYLLDPSTGQTDIRCGLSRSRQA